MLVVSTTVAAVVSRIARSYRPVSAMAVAAALTGLVAGTSLAVAGKPLWGGGLAQTAAVAGTFSADAVLLMSPGLAGTHVPTSLAYLHELDTVLVQRGPSGGRRPSSIAQAIHLWLARGRPVFLVFTDRDFLSFFAPEFSLVEIGHARIDLLMLERTRSRAPQAAVRGPIRLRVFQVRESDRVGRRSISGIPPPTCSSGWKVSILRNATAKEDGTFRWSKALASLTITGGGDVALTVAGGRPAGGAAGGNRRANGRQGGGPAPAADRPRRR